MNSMWQKMGANMREVNSVTRGKVIASSKSGWLCVNFILFRVWSIQKQINLLL